MKKAVLATLVLLVGGLPAAFAQKAPAGYLSLEQYDSARQKPAEAKAAVVYEAVRGASLRATLERWAVQSGWQPLAWKLPEETDFTLGASARFEGDFLTATRAFVASLGPEAELRVRFNQGNRLVVVEPLQ